MTADVVSPRRARMRLGVTFMLLSGVLWFSLFAIPFLSLTMVQKASLGGAVFAGVQITWWSGAALAGPGVVRKVSGWFRRPAEPRPDRQDRSPE